MTYQDMDWTRPSFQRESSDSMSTEARWIKPADGTYAPRCVVSIVTETDCIDRISEEGAYMHRLKRIHVAESHRPYTIWTAPLYRSFDSGAALFDWLEESRNNRRRTYLFAPDVTDVFTLSAFWQRIEREGCKLTGGLSLDSPPADAARPAAANRPHDPPDVPGGAKIADSLYHFSNLSVSVNSHTIEYRRFKSSFRWCSHFQYIQSSEEEVASSIGYQWKLTADTPHGLPNTVRMDAERCLMWLRFYQHLSDWWCDNDAGPWASTVASCSYGFLRRRIKPQTILHHDNDAAAATENAAIFAGRRSIWYVGNIGSEEQWAKYPGKAPKRSTHGTINQWMVHSDIRSMYPHILATMPYPVRLIENVESPSRDTLADMLSVYGVIASVIIDSQSGEYPHRGATGVNYPRGVFATVLCGAELMRAMACDEIRYVKHASVYAMDYPFRDACEKLLECRIAARSEKRAGWELFIKMLSNSMSGRIAMVPHIWEKRPDKCPLSDWGYWPEMDTDTQLIHQYRSVAGMAWERVLQESCIRPMGAAYAYLCSYGRHLMSGVRGMCPAGTVLAQDTDGIWTTHDAARILYGTRCVTPDGAGELAWKSASPVGRFYGPQHYWYGNAWVMSGSKVFAHRPASDSVVVRERRQAVLTCTHTPPEYVIENIVQRDINRLQAPGTISADGWIEPHTLWMQCDDDLQSRY